MGVTISLDDFGTGYSSLLRLSSMPVDEIKIDRVFVSCLSEGSRAIGIVRALIELAHALGVPAIAEGVETQQEWEILDALGCDGVQGWHVGMPMARAEVTEWVRSHQLTCVPPRARVHGHVFGPHLVLAAPVVDVEPVEVEVEVQRPRAAAETADDAAAV
jgi:predicted signal transduction protein with EAL and GGDEF domain